MILVLLLSWLEFEVHISVEVFMEVDPVEGNEFQDDLFINLGDVFLQIGNQRQGILVEYELFYLSLTFN